MSNFRGNINQNIKRDVKIAKEKLPYTFIPVDREKNKLVDRNDFNIYKNDLYTGEINCSMIALNQLCVGNEHKAIGGDLEQTEIMPLKIDNKIVIPASSLKGCISNLIAQFLKLPMTRVEEKGFTFRPNINPKSGENIKLAAGLIVGNEQDEFKILKIDMSDNKNTPNVMFFNDKTPLERKEIKLPNITIISDKNKFDVKSLKYRSLGYKIKYDKNGNEENFCIFDYQNGIDGYGSLARLFTNNTPPIHNRFAVKESYIKSLVKPIYLFLSKEKLEEYKKTVKTLANDHLKDHPLIGKDSKQIADNIAKTKKLEKGDIIFFEYDINSKEILTFGKHYRYRWAFSRSTISSKPDIGYLSNEFKDKKLSIFRDMFGYTINESELENLGYDKKEIDKIDKAFSGKIHFNNAVCVSDKKFIKKDLWLPRPGSPKASAYEFYIRQDLNNNNPEFLNTYGDPARYGEKIRLSGRKTYKKSTKLILPPQDFKKEKNSVKLSEYFEKDKNEDSYPEFKFCVRFENLSDEELNLLVMGLTLGNKKSDKIESGKILCNQIGYGKNYGMGAIKISIDKMKLVNYKDSKITVSEKSEDQLLEEIKSYIDNILKDNDLKSSLTYGDIGLGYPTGGNENDTKGWHSNIRQEDMKLRRVSAKGGVPTNPTEKEGKSNNDLKPGQKVKVVFDKIDGNRIFVKIVGSDNCGYFFTNQVVSEAYLKKLQNGEEVEATISEKKGDKFYSFEKLK